MKKLQKQVKGITLTALVVTIIVLLILAGVAINLAIGNNGLFTRAQEAAEISRKESAREKLNLILSDVQLNRIPKGKSLAISDDLASEIEGYKEVTSAKVSGKIIEVVIDGYTFEVNGDLGVENGLTKVEPDNLADWTYRVDETDGKAILQKYNGTATKLVVPNYINGYWVKQVGDGGFIWGDNIVETVEKYDSWQSSDTQNTITEIIISDGIEVIGTAAFKYARALEEVTIPRSVQTIGSWAFKTSSLLTKDINKLKKLDIHDGVKTVGLDIFNGRDDIIINVEYTEQELPIDAWSNLWNVNQYYNGEEYIQLKTTINYGVTMK